MNGLSAKKAMQRCGCMLLAALLALPPYAAGLSAQAAGTNDGAAAVTAAAAEDAPSYVAYLRQYADAPCPDGSIRLDAAAAAGGERRTDFEGHSGVSLYAGETDTVTWQFSVPQTGLYLLRFDYYPVAGAQGEIERSLRLDGAAPFTEADSLTLFRVWANTDEPVRTDTQGNQILIEQVEKPVWMQQYALDPSGLSGSPLRFYLTAGAHTLTLAGVMEPVVLAGLTFCPVSSGAAAPYAEQLAAHPDAGDVSAAASVTLQAEQADRKSSQMLYPLNDKTSPTVEPYSSSKIVYNTIGGNQWTNAGQWLEWDFVAPESGFYTLSAHFKQALKDGRSSVRSVTIDGALPFSEAESWMFPYESAWQTGRFSDEKNEPYRFYLEKGPHTLRLTVGLGAYSQVISDASLCLRELNAIYRQIIAISGANPDQYRDYKFDETIPSTIEAMGEMTETLKVLEKNVLAIEGVGRSVSDIQRVYSQLDMMLEDTDTIAVRLTAFKDSVASFGTWINTQRGQPLQLDWLRLGSAEEELPRGEAGFFGLAAHYIKSFAASFSTDYQSIGQTELASDRSIKVWMTTSQDQAQMLRQLATGDFTVKTGVAAEVQLVSTKALLPAILAKKGPDVALGIAQADVNNLALRNAIRNVAEFDDAAQVQQSFYDYSLVPFRWQDGLYGLPETQVWQMLFYRKDILKELGIGVEELETWDSVLYSVLPKLKKSSLSFGIMPTIQNYLVFMYQQGGSLYEDNGRTSGLQSPAAIESMKLYSMLYTQYGFQLSYDFSNRFRNGEMPVAIADFTSYNNLMLFASEIKGLWGMLPVPGTVRADGTVDHTAVSTVTGTVMMSGTRDEKAAWEFMKWWTSADTQDAFGKRLEAVVGAASRYNTANKQAISQVRWDPDMRQSMLTQAENLQAYPEVPGGYFTARLFNFAFRSIVYEAKDVRESMIDTAQDIDREMANKREEYGIE